VRKSFARRAATYAVKSASRSIRPPFALLTHAEGCRVGYRHHIYRSIVGSGTGPPRARSRFGDVSIRIIVTTNARAEELDLGVEPHFHPGR
jgi:hypothetical protein